ncbi:MAG: hypothetical protein KF811_05500 [Dokdonella sp.]|nr:hypothetical protein [Dokdonella sp.]
MARILRARAESKAKANGQSALIRLWHLLPRAGEGEIRSEAASAGLREFASSWLRGMRSEWGPYAVAQRRRQGPIVSLSGIGTFARTSSVGATRNTFGQAQEREESDRCPADVELKRRRVNLAEAGRHDDCCAVPLATTKTPHGDRLVEVSALSKLGDSPTRPRPFDDAGGPERIHTILGPDRHTNGSEQEEVDQQQQGRAHRRHARVDAAPIQSSACCGRTFLLATQEKVTRSPQASESFALRSTNAPRSDVGKCEQQSHWVPACAGTTMWNSETCRKASRLKALLR